MLETILFVRRVGCGMLFNIQFILLGLRLVFVRSCIESFVAIAKLALAPLVSPRRASDALEGEPDELAQPGVEQFTMYGR
jgi:hypothetical protein